MGCNSSSVVPLGEGDVVDGAGIRVRVNPSTPDTVVLSPRKKKTNAPPLESSEPPEETLTKDFNVDAARRAPPPPPPPTAFEVPANDDSLIRKHPPKRFRRLGDHPPEPPRTLTQEMIDSRQQEAETRRREILSQRIRSAQQKNGSSHGRKLVHSDAFSQKSEDLSDWEKKM